jgi:fatty acid desaturase
MAGNLFAPTESPTLRFSEEGWETRSMAALPNLGGMSRAGYVVAGIALAAWGLFGANAGWVEVLWLVVGGTLIVEGVIGF